MSHVFPELFGNDAIKERLGRALRNGTFPHAIILSGPRGSGRRTLARLIAAALFCKERDAATLPCGTCEDCRRVREGILPDLHIIAPEEGKALIPVGRIRELRAEMSLSAVEGGYRVFVIEEADRMNAAAQNALLISLEEPPEGVFLLLVAESEEALLPTVRSRCQTVRTELFEPEQLKEYLLREERFAKLLREEPDKVAPLLGGAHGTIGGALTLLGGGKLTAVLKRREIVDRILAALATRGAAPLYEALHPLASTKREEVAELLSLLGEALRDLILLKRAPDAPLLYYGTHSEALEASERIGIRKLYTMADAVEAAAEDLLRNANLTVIVSTLLFAAIH